MKKTDIAMTIFIAGVSVLIAIFIANTFNLGVDPDGREVKTVEEISSTIEEPDAEVFNAEAINPTVQIVIGN
ncbi:hypothetical protein FJZ39_02065 [Candidatus Saccharibacteria bacterium]|nr:hypothetical protein [Candidatus Saccharibacteria bacterium]